MPSAINSDSTYIAPLCITLSIKTWVVAYFNPKTTFQKLFNCFSPLRYVTFYCGPYNSFKILEKKNFDLKKLKKPPSKVAQKYLKSTALLPWLPKRP